MAHRLGCGEDQVAPLAVEHAAPTVTAGIMLHVEQKIRGLVRVQHGGAVARARFTGTSAVSS
jgi:hypothetical protein